MSYNIKDMVRDGKRVCFVRYRHGELIYITECGFEFPVPIDDTGDGVFLAEDKAMLFMRYIRKHIESIKKEEDEQIRQILQEEIDQSLINDMVKVAKESNHTHPLFPNLLFKEPLSPEFVERLDNLTQEDLEELSKVGENALAAGRAFLTASNPQ